MSIASGHLILDGENATAGTIILFAEHEPIQNRPYSIFYADAIFSPSVEDKKNSISWEDVNVFLDTLTKKSWSVGARKT